MFRIVIEKETPEEAYEELKRAAVALQPTLFVSAASQPSGCSETNAAPKKPRGKKEGNVSLPAENSSVASATAEQPSAPAQGEAGDAQGEVASEKDSQAVHSPVDDSKPASIEDVRAVLGAKMKDGKGAEVNALVTSYAPALSKVPADKLAELLAKAKEL